MKRIPLALVFLFVSACASQQIRTDGLPVNLVQVRADVWRSGQPVGDEWRLLYELGVRHSITLSFQNERDDPDEDAARAAGIEVHAVYTQPSTKGIDWISHPSDAAMDALWNLAIRIRDAKGEQGAWLVHCKNGHDRTGLVVGLIRMVVDGWSAERAWAEMLERGYHPQLIGLNHAFREFAERAER